MKEWGRGVEVVLLACSWKCAIVGLAFVASFAAFRLCCKNEQCCGEDYIKQGLFRIGTSRLANLLASAIVGEDIAPFSSKAANY